MLSARYLPVLGGGVEALVSQMLLEQSEPVSCVIELYRMNCESIAQAMGAYVMNPATLTINQFCQPGSLTTVSHNLPTAVTINTENQLPAVSNDRTATPDVFPEQLQAFTVNGQRSLPTVQPLFSLTVFYLAAAFGAEHVRRSESCSAGVAEELDAGLEMLNHYYALAEVHVLNLQPQELGYAAAQPKQEPDKEMVS